MFDLSTYHRRLQYLQEWINLSADSRAQEIFFRDFMKNCGIDYRKFPSDRLIYEDFAGYVSQREYQRELLHMDW